MAEPVFTFDARRLRRLRIIAKANDTTIGDIESDQICNDLMICDTEGCGERGVHRFTCHRRRGTIREVMHLVRFCDECWGVNDDNVCFADVSKHKFCYTCGLDLMSPLDEDVPTVTMIEDETVRVCHNTCGVLCSVCCLFITDKKKMRCDVPFLAGQNICKDCLGDVPADKFVQTNPALVRPSSPGSLFLRVIRPTEPGPRHRGTVGYARAEIQKADKARLVSALAKRPAEPLAAPRKVRKSEVE